MRKVQNNRAARGGTITFGLRRLWSICRVATCRLLLLMNPTVRQVCDFGEVEQVITTKTLCMFPIVPVFVASVKLGVVVRSAIGIFILEDRS